jgi:predicted site-specific integrase-resolvase
MKQFALPPPLLTETEAAHQLALNVKTLRRWRWAGKGPRFLKIGGAVRYDPNDLDEYVAASRRSSTSDAVVSTLERNAA